VLDGGLDKWKAEGPGRSRPARRAALPGRDLRGSAARGLFVDAAAVKAAIGASTP